MLREMLEVGFPWKDLNAIAASAFSDSNSPLRYFVLLNRVTVEFWRSEMVRAIRLVEEAWW